MRIHHLFKIIIAIVLLNSACVRQDTAHPISGGILRIGDVAKLRPINPLTTSSGLSASLVDLVYDYLIRFDKNGNPKAELATHWELSFDKKIWTFHLRNDAYFHDGSRVTAHDIKATYEKVLELKNVSASNKRYLENVSEINVINDNTLQLKLTKYDHNIWFDLGTAGIMPKRYLLDDPNFDRFNKHPIGSGPYKFVKQEPNEIILSANREHFQTPYIDHIIVKILPNQLAILNNLISGEIDMALLLNPEDYGSLERIKEIKVYRNWPPFLYMMLLSHNNKLFQSETIRTALKLAIDKKMIAQRLLNDSSSIAINSSPPSNTSKNINSYNPQKALKILKENGWKLSDYDRVLTKDNEKFIFTVRTIEGNTFGLKVAQLIQEQLSQLGIIMKLETLPFPNYMENVFSIKDFSSAIIHLAYRPYYNLDFYLWHSSQIEKGINATSFADSQIDHLLDVTRFDPDSFERDKAKLGLQKRLMEKNPAIFLFWHGIRLAIYKKFQGIPESQLESFRDFTKIWVPKKEQITTNNVKVDK